MPEPGGYLPALRFQALTRVYDPLIALTTREATFRRALFERAEGQDGQRILDLGCGTGSLALMAKSRHPGTELVGLDADPSILERARSKAEQQGLEITFDRGLATELPYQDGSFDRVLSTLVFHHLGAEGISRTAVEIARVLRPGGELHLADWGPPSDPAMAALSWQVRLLDGIERTRENFEGRIPGHLSRVGLSEIADREQLRTVFGTLVLYAFAAQKPSG